MAKSKLRNGSVRTSPRFHVGDWVTYESSEKRVWVQIIEDRGCLGVGRERLYRVRRERSFDDVSKFTMPESELDPAGPEPEQVIDFLNKGGLLELLRTNVGGEPSPRAWLTFDSRGNLSVTLDEFRGANGGAEVPFFALYENSVVASKTPAVVEFLTGFGLDRSQAEDVIETVGTTLVPA